MSRPRGWNAGLTDPGPMCEGGRGEVKVVSVEARGQLDAGWLAATIQNYSAFIPQWENSFVLYPAIRGKCVNIVHVSHSREFFCYSLLSSTAHIFTV